MHRMKTIYELNTLKHNNHKTKQYKNKDPFMKKPQRNTNPERLLDNGTLDTFLFRIRMEMLDVDKHKQNRQDNLTRKERLALRELTQNPHIIINKADKGSTIVVEDRDEYITNAMSHLNDPNEYQPFTEDISPVLKQNIISRLMALKNNGLIK